jgi:hypothetical protein
MDWKNTPKGVKAKVEKADKKAKSGGDPHGRTTKEKVTDFAKGVGLTSGQKKAREFAKGGLLLASGVAGNLASRAANIVKKAHAHKKE